MSFGLADAGLASIATFAMGLAAARMLSPADLGAYAVYFAAFLLGAVIPTQLILVPAEVIITSNSADDRLRRLTCHRRTLLLGAIATAPGILATGLAYALSGATPSVAVPLAVTASAATVLSPLQDHMRRMAHLSGVSNLAALTSLVQVAGVIAAIFSLTQLAVPAAWVPFGALACANALSLTVAVVTANVATRKRAPDRSISRRLTVRSLTGRGKWLLFSSVIGTGSGFVASLTITTLAGAEWLGYSEAARTVAQPLLVLVTGLSAVTGPISTQAAAAGDIQRARRVSRTFMGVVIFTAAAGLLLVGGDWSWNPMLLLVPKAYDVAWLVAFTIVANLSTGMLWPYRSELLGGHREPSLARVDLLSGLALIGAAVTAPWTRAFARPLGALGVGATRHVGYLWSLRSHYHDSAGESGDSRIRQ